MKKQITESADAENLGGQGTGQIITVNLDLIKNTSKNTGMKEGGKLGERMRIQA